MRVSLQLAPGTPGSIAWHSRSQDLAWEGPAHSHCELELNLVVRGSASLLVGQARHELLPGAMAWLLPEQEHILLRQSRDFAMWVVVFSLPFVRERRHLPELRSLRPHTLHPSAARIPAEPAFDALRSVCEAAQTDPPRGGGAASLLPATLHYLLLAGWTAFRAAPIDALARNLHPAVAKAVALLRSDPARECLADLASEVCLSYSRLSRLFHRQTGVTLEKFRSRTRLRHFLKLHPAPGGPLNLTQAAFAAGFQSYVQFYRVFREETGGSPSRYFTRPRG